MGAQIAAHLANAGVPVDLLDVSRDAAIAGLTRLKTLKPDPLFLPELADLVRPGDFGDTSALKRADWVIEAVVEEIDAKRTLLARVTPHVKPGAIVTSNTSGIPLAAIAHGQPPAFQRRWLGTHFFNPPRYLPLVELIPTDATDPEIARTLRTFLDRRLGKGVVEARDTPGFIANRIGIFGAVRALDAVVSGDYTIEDVDEVTGPLIGRPKSATFRTMDLAGLDILVRVADDLAERLSGRWDADGFRVPALIRKMVDRGLLGEKSGGGFYRRAPGRDAPEITTLDLASLRDHSEEPRFRSRTASPLPGLESARAIPHLGDRLRALFGRRDRTGDLLRRVVGETIVYAARVAPEIAHSVDDVDRAMRWGFGWELGPIETWDAVGLEAVQQSMALAEPPALVRDVIGAGRTRFRNGELPPAGAGSLLLRTSKALAPPVRRNAGASLIDLGDGVLALEFHSKMNTLGGDAVEMIASGVRDAAANFSALVIGTEAEVFSAGANLLLLLLEAQEGHWEEVDLMVRAFQGATTAIKTAAVPVVAAPGGLALGGGCEICLHTDRVQAAAETYLGLVEAGVGLIPAGGGTKEMMLRAIDRAGSAPALPHLQRAFETMAMGKVSTSAPDARRLGYLRDADGITMNRERIVADAKAVALERVGNYQPKTLRAAVPVGGADLLATLSLGVHLAHRGGRASDHDALVGRKLAWVMSGGDLPHRAEVAESYLLDLEREAFLSLCGERKTLERIGHTLKTGKTLRN